MDVDALAVERELLMRLERRDVKRAAWSSCQKSLRGFAKCGRAAAETRPG